jgi:hypothetical protein
MATQLQYRHIPWQIETFQVYIYVFLQPERYQDIIKPSNMLLKYWKFLSFLSLFVCVCVCVFVWQGLTSIVPAGHKFKIHLHQPLHCCDYTCVSLFQEQQQKFLRNWFVCVHTCVCVCVCVCVYACACALGMKPRASLVCSRCCTAGLVLPCHSQNSTSYTGSQLSLHAAYRKLRGK